MSYLSLIVILRRCAG